MVETTKEKVSELGDAVVSYLKDITKLDAEVKVWHINTLKTKDGNTVDQTWGHNYS